MYRVLVTIILLSFAFIQSWGQNDRYSDIHETIGQTIQLYEIDKLHSTHSPFIYKKNDKGKLVKEKEFTTYTQLQNVDLKVVGIETIKKTSYWILDSKGEMYYFLIGNMDYCKNIKSVSYWEQEFDNYSKKYSHYISSEASKDMLESYQQIRWIDFVMPQDIDKTPSFRFEASETPVSSVVPSDIKNENGYLTQEEYLCIKKRIEVEVERLDSIADSNHIIQVRIARNPIVYEYFEQNKVFDDAPHFNHLRLDNSYATPSKYTTYSIEKEWDYYFTVFNYNAETKTFIGYCKGQILELPKSTFAKSINLKEEQYLIRRGDKGFDIRKKKAFEYDKAFYASSKHLEKIKHLKPDNKSTSSSDKIGQRYVVKKEYYDFQNNFLRVIATDEVLKNNIPRDEVFVFIDICEDETLTWGNVAIFENPTYGYCWLESAFSIDSYLEEYDKAIENNKKRKEWERRMIEKYGDTNGKLIISGKVRIGFTAEMCRNSWGKPSDINRTTTAYGVHEQWVYEHGNYLYFEDGILTTIQN